MRELNFEIPVVLRQLLRKIYVTVLLALFLACVIVLVIAVIVWRPRDAGIFPMKYWMPRYRALGEPYLPPHKATSTQVTHNTR